MSRPHVVSPAELSSLRDLELFARTTVEGLRQGLHRSPFHGYSAEFSQYRHYRPGDDLKYVDWKAFGRTDRLYSRQFRETTNMSALFVVDISRSMNFPEAEPSTRAVTPRTKAALARAAAAVLSTLVIDQGDAAGILASAGDAPALTRYVPPRSGRHHLHLCLAELARLPSDATTSVAGALRRAATLSSRRGMVIVISDFYDDGEVLPEMRRLHRMGHDLLAIHVMAAEELRLPPGGAIEFEDLETGSRRSTDAVAVAAEYERNVTAFLTHVRQSVAREGLGYLQLTTGESLEAALRRYLVARRGGR